MPEISPSKYRVDVTWDEVPHLTEEAKAELLAGYPPHMRDVRTKGIPSLGIGAIYPVDIDTLLIEPHQIPAYWPRCYALDVGWKRTAALWAAHDRENDAMVLYSEYYGSEEKPAVHAAAIRARGPWIRGCIDPASRGRSQEDGRRLIDAYRGAGLNLTPADNAVEAGIHQVYHRMTTGRLKVFRTLTNWQREFSRYHRATIKSQFGETVRIVKEDDHLMDCWDSETEVLTRSGWKLWPQASAADEFATVDLDTDEIEYQSPTAMVARPYVGEMVRISGRKLDALCTPNHRMVVYPRGANRPVVKAAGDMSVWDRIKLRATWVGECRGPLPVQSAYGRSAEIEPLVWAELLGWYVAEGYATRTIQMPGRGYQVAISQVKPNTAAQLQRLLSKTPWVWSYRSGAFHASCKWLWEQVAPLGLQGARFVPQWVKDSSPDVIEAFIRGAVAGDGWTQGKTRTYATISRRLADDMQELFFKTGKTASVRVGRAAGRMTVNGRMCDTQEQYWVAEWNSPYGLLRDSRNAANFRRERYSGMVYCATVPNGTLVVRRNGRPMIAGNCMRYVELNHPKIMSVRPVESPISDGASVGDDIAGY